MKGIRLSFLAGSAVALAAAGALGAAITPGNLLVYRVGDGAAPVLNTGAVVFVDEFTPAGTLVQSISLNSAGAGNKLIASGTASSEGLLTVSPNGNYVALTGYNRTLGGASLAGTTGAAVNRTVGIIPVATGTPDLSTSLSDFADGNNPRSAVTTNGTDIWVTGGAGGVRYTTAGSATSTQLSTTLTNLRQVNIFDNQLLVSTGSGSAVRVGTVGSGLPTSSGQTITNLPGFLTAGSPYAFFMADLDAGVAGSDTLYVADDAADAFRKYSLVAGAWTLNGTIGVNADDYRGVTGFVTPAGVQLFATRKGGTSGAGGGELVSLLDASGYNGAFAGVPVVLSTASVNTAFRGVAYVPVAIPTAGTAALMGLAGLAAARRRRA